MLTSKFLKNSNVQSLLANSVSAALGFVSFLLLIRILEMKVFGQWVLYITGATFIEIIRFGLLKTALVYFLAGAGPDEEKRLKGSNLGLSIMITALIALLLLAVNGVFPQAIEKSGYILFFTWYPILAFVNLPFHNAISIAQAKQRFDRILLLKVANNGGFVLFLGVNYFFFQWGIHYIVIAHLAIYGLFSLFAMGAGWDGNRHWRRCNMASAKKILNYGRFAVGTLVGSNLLKSADTFIISLSPFLGASGVALYSVPLKLTEVPAILLNSLSAVAFPKFSRTAARGNIRKLRQLFYDYSGVVTAFFMALAVGGFIFARDLVVIIGGEEYAHTHIIFKVFCVYALLLPVERFTGVALDSLNMPHKNMKKVMIMSLANIAGNLMVVGAIAPLFPSLLTVNLLAMVAAVTVVVTIGGQMAGFYFLKNKMPVSYFYIFINLQRVIIMRWRKVKGRPWRTR